MPRISGMLLALLAAVTFGATAPLVQAAGRGVGPFVTAALLYAGAAAVAVVSRAPGGHEAPLRGRHAPRVVAVALLGAVLAPASLAWGLQHAGGAAASLLLTLEPVLTVLLGAWFYREPVGGRIAAAVALLTCGALVVALPSSAGAHAEAAGLAAVALATLFWALDNTVAVPLASVDPGRVVLAKAGLGALLSTAVAIVLGERAPSPGAMLALFACGATGYGVSLRLYLRAQRSLGAGRTASIFATAPFVAAFVAFALGQPLGAFIGVGAALMAAGLALHLTEHHAHRHVHAALAHEHAHRHDDGHHTHVHDPMPVGAHSHWHEHTPLEHEHAHMPDEHHAHSH